MPSGYVAIRIYKDPLMVFLMGFNGDSIAFNGI